MASLAESGVEQTTLGLLEAVGWSVLHSPDIAPDTIGAERADCGKAVLA